MKVLVLKGGPDAERPVSLESGGRVAAALRRAGVDVEEREIGRLTAAELRALPGQVVFPVLHGPWGEGGPLQELLDADGRPYVGSGPGPARRAMDKLATKHAAEEAGIPTPESQSLTASEPCRVPLPLVLKPVDDGSSVDLRVCRSAEEVARARAELHPRRPRLMAERFITGREITVGVLDFLPGRVLPLIEIRAAGGLYDYEAKYHRDDTQYILDPELPAAVADACRRGAVAICDALRVRDVARVDFMVDERGPWLLEVNTMPGFTDHSLVPKAAAHAGIPMADLCRGLAERALARSGAQLLQPGRFAGR
ncbi:MAG: D-alanine--D-alanine ligase [Phycisphaerales bacterium]